MEEELEEPMFSQELTPLLPPAGGELHPSVGFVAEKTLRSQFSEGLGDRGRPHSHLPRQGNRPYPFPLFLLLPIEEEDIPGLRFREHPKVR